MIARAGIPDHKPSINTRIILALAHASILLPGAGIFVPLLLWCFRRKFPHIMRKQALQAIIFQLFQWIYLQLVALLIMLCVFILAFIFTKSRVSPEVYSNRVLVVGMISIGMIVLAWAVYVLFGLVGAVVCLAGGDYKYPILGPWMERYIAKNLMTQTDIAKQGAGVNTIPEGVTLDTDRSDQEDRESLLIAAGAHGAILIPLIGIMIPLVLVLFDKDKALPVRFQTLQALFFQGFGQVISFVLFGCQLFTAGMIGLPMAFIDITDRIFSSEPLLLGIGFLFILLLLINIFILLFTPLLATFGIIASVQVLRGKRYQYPFLGTWLIARMRF